MDRVRIYDAKGNAIAFSAEDAAHASGDRGIMLLAVRKDTAAALAGTDGDYIPLIVDATGRLWVAPLAANSGVDIGDVDVLTLPALTGTNPGGATAPLGAFAGAGDAQGQGTVLTGRGMFFHNPDDLWDSARSIAASGAGLGVLKTGTLGELITLAASAARTTDANGTAVTGLGWRNRYIVLFDLTVADTDAGDTLNVYIDVSLDGTTWLNAAHFTQIIGTDAASKRYAVLDPSAPGTAEILVTADAAAGVVRPSMFGAQMRARWAIVDAGTDDASFTFSVSAYAL